MMRLLIAVALLCHHSEGLISCKNEQGAAVDWYILYKKPNSYDFYYIDPSKNNGFERGSRSIDHQAGVLANTLDPIFAPTPTCGYVGYSDQPPTGYAKTGCGHSKGIVMVDEQNVVWLLHSTPRFPFTRHSNDFYPKNGKLKAQTFICATFPRSQLQTIEQHLRFISAHIFNYTNENMFSVDVKNFYNVWIPKDELNKKTQLYQNLSNGNQEFKVFFKKISSDAAGGDLYVAIANAVDSNVFAQTWGCQRGRCDSYCPATGPQVFNINSIKFSSAVNWTCGSDHSKWCVSESNDWVCVGDSNRSETQFQRPGGALCLSHSVTKAAFMKVKSDTQSC